MQQDFRALMAALMGSGTPTYNPRAAMEPVVDSALAQQAAAIPPEVQRVAEAIRPRVIFGNPGAGVGGMRGWGGGNGGGRQVGRGSSGAPQGGLHPGGHGEY